MANNAVLQQRTSQPVQVSKVPSQVEGPRALPVLFDFTIAPTLEFSANYSDVGMSMVQSIFIDNSNNSSSATFYFYSSAQELVIPPFTQGMFPVLLVGNLNIQVRGTSAGNTKVPVQILNVPLEPYVWNARTPRFDGAVTVEGVVTVQSDSGVYTDYSGSVVSGGASQQVIASNGTRKRLFIQNPASAERQNIAMAESLFVNFSGPAASGDVGSIELLPGQSLDTGIGPMSTEALSVSADTSGHRYTIKELN